MSAAPSSAIAALDGAASHWHEAAADRFARPVAEAASTVPGFVDLHFHLLPGLDDGPPTLALARQLAQDAVHAGTLAVVATPHCSRRHRFDPRNVATRLRQMEAGAPQGLFLFTGCELELKDDPLRDLTNDWRGYTLNRSRYVLVELPSLLGCARIEKGLRALLDEGFVPILAHPERHAFARTQGEALAGWVQAGCLAQLTAASLCGRLGRPTLDASLKMLEAGLVHFVASDAHDSGKRPPDLRDAYRHVARIAGAHQAARLFTYNPLAVLHDEPLP